MLLGFIHASSEQPKICFYYAAASGSQRSESIYLMKTPKGQHKLFTPADYQWQKKEAGHLLTDKNTNDKYELKYNACDYSAYAERSDENLLQPTVRVNHMVLLAYFGKKNFLSKKYDLEKATIEMLKNLISDQVNKSELEQLANSAKTLESVQEEDRKNQITALKKVSNKEPDESLITSFSVSKQIALDPAMKDAHFKILKFVDEIRKKGTSIYEHIQNLSSGSACEHVVNGLSSPEIKDALTDNTTRDSASPEKFLVMEGCQTKGEDTVENTRQNTENPVNAEESSDEKMEEVN